MRKYLILAAAFVIGAGAAGSIVPSQAQPYGPGYGMGYGMMGGYGWGDGQGWSGGPGMMGYGGGPGWGWMHGWRGGYGPGMMGGYGPGMMYGYGPGAQADLKLTVDQVKTHFEQMIRNPNLKVGDVKEKDADTIVAEIVTKQGNSLVQRVDVNRHNGFMQPEQ